MPRYDDDSDDERLPDGMRRTGYDADTQTYTFRDARGAYYEGPAGVRHPAHFTRVPAPSWPSLPEGMRAALTAEREKSWRQEHSPLLSFFLLVALFLLGVFWLMRYSLGGGGPAPVVCGGRDSWVVGRGDTCWEIAREKGVSVEELLGENAGLDCGHLQVGRIVCLPPSSSGV